MKVIFLVDDFIIEPLGIGYLGAVLKEQGHDVDLVKTYGKFSIPEEIRHLQKEKIVFAYSVTTGTHQYYLSLSGLIKSFFENSISVFGGPHPTYFPEILKDGRVDFIIRGEGEVSFPELVRKIENKGVLPDFKKQSDFPGVTSLIEKLDSIPFPDRDLLYKYEKNYDNPIKSIMTMRGCPYSCSYCYNVLYKKLYLEKGQRLVRFRSARNIIEECKELKDYPLEMIYFQDDEFTANPNFRELMCLYKDEVAIPFHAQIRIDRVKDENIKLLKEAGCLGVTFAIESGSEKIRKNLLNRHMTNEQILNGVKILRKYNLKFRTENMIGIPTETKNDILQTVKLNIECKPDVGWSSIFQPYPNLELGNKCIEMGLWKCDVDKFKPSFFDETELKFPKAHARFVNNIQKFFGFIVRHKWVLPFINILSFIPENEYFVKFYKWYKQRCYDKLYETPIEEETCQKVEKKLLAWGTKVLVTPSFPKR